ncbi:MAG TPA: CPBP family intramembrane glutamic endopeptidase [Candidatus Saccharimonadales bacterium]|nr:CPBP family intramembrane glutamic endopeptidase [Candidatus Saccharimonadales bacterium]
MSFREDNSLDSANQNPDSPLGENHPENSASPAPAAAPVATGLSGDRVRVSDIPYAQRPDVPEDLRITWSWVHLIFLVIFSVLALVVVQTILSIHYAPHEQLSAKELQQFLLGLPQFVVITTVALFGAVFLFFYVTLSVLPGQPFWATLGWRKLRPPGAPFFARAWIFVVLGAILSLFVTLVGSQVHTPEDMPVEALMKTRTGFILMMGMAVAVAPLVEETLFRGYLYPLLVRLVSSSAVRFGAAPASATRAGIAISIVTTGVLFGLLHGGQLSWTWGIVSLLIFVGITFTYVRARTGTVVASFLMHLGYNSLIAILSLFQMHAP